MKTYKYEIRRETGSTFTCRNLTWIERLRYKINGCKVIKLY